MNLNDIEDQYLIKMHKKIEHLLYSTLDSLLIYISVKNREVSIIRYMLCNSLTNFVICKSITGPTQ